MKVVFPKASTDNMIFFTNFILPAHLLWNETLETYINTFYQNPVGTNCARIQQDQLSTENIIFDLSACEDIPLKYYQIKFFDTQEDMDVYVSTEKETIDLIIGNQAYTGYTNNKVVLNKFITLFFNTQRTHMSHEMRQNIASLVHNEIYSGENIQQALIQDHFLFENFLPLPEQETITNIFTRLGEQQVVSVKEPSIETLPNVLSFSSKDNEEQEYILANTIQDKHTLELSFDKNYDKISVSYNDGIEYFPESFNARTQTSLYNLNPLYRNIKAWRNTYTIKTYIDNQHTETFSIVLHYLSEPSYPTKEEITTNNEQFQPISIVYFNDYSSKQVAEALTTLFDTYGISDYFVLKRFDDPDTFAGKIQSKDYDIVIRAINMWLRKDISNIFGTTSPNLNPSLYIDEDLVQRTNEYFLFDDTSRQEIKKKIDLRYLEETPFIILGKEFGNISIKESLGFTYPFRLYVLGWRKDFIKDLPIFQHVRIDRDKFRDMNNFKRFLAQ